VADELKTCANCGHAQASGVFCEVCGTKLPEGSAVAATAAASPEPAPVAAPVAAAAVAPAAAPTPVAAAPVAAAAAAAPAPPPPPPPPPAAQPQYAPAPQAQPGVYADITDKGFWSKFFDLSFRHYITPSVIKVLFILFMVVIALSVIGGIINGFLWSPALGVFALIAGLIGGFVWLILARVFLEVIMVFFNIDRNTDGIAKNKR
jgi:hypothetical protein